MFTYYAYYFALIGIGVFFHTTGLMKSRKVQAFYMGVVCLTLTVIGGLRSFSVGYDGRSYQSTFNYFANTSWKTPWEYNHYMEYGFYVFCKVLAMFGGTARTMVIVSSGFIYFAVCRFLYKNSTEMFVSALVLLSYPYFYTSFDLIRFYMAISVILLAYEYVKKRKFVPYLIWTLVAALLHKSAIIFIALYWLPKVKWNAYSIILTGMLALAVTLFSRQVMVLASIVFNDYTSYVSGVNAYWAGSFSGGIKTFVMYLVLLVLSAAAYLNKHPKTVKTNQSLGYVLLTVAVAMIFMNASIAIRFLVAMLPFMSVSISELLCYKDHRNKQTQMLLRLAVGLICVAYHTFLVWNDWQNIVPYGMF